MIIMLFIYSLVFIFIGVLFFIKKKKLIGGMFVLLAIMLAVIGIVTIALYPHLWPF